MKLVFVSALLIGGLVACSEDEVKEEITKSPVQEPLEVQNNEYTSTDSEEVDEKVSVDFIQLIARLPLQGLQPIEEGIGLSEEEVNVLPDNMKSFDSHVELKFSAISKFSSNEEQAFIVHVESFDSLEIEAFQEDEFYYLVLVDALGLISTFEPIHALNTVEDGMLVSSGWYEMEDINVSVKKIRLYKATINIVEESTETFSGDEGGYNEATDYQNDLHFHNAIDQVAKPANN